MTVQELLTDESKWTTKSYARDRSGRAVGYLNSDAVCWCVLGAVSRCYLTGSEWCSALKRVRRALGLTYEGPIHEVFEWNDKPGRTFTEVQELVKKAGI